MQRCFVPLSTGLSENFHLVLKSIKWSWGSCFCLDCMFSIMSVWFLNIEFSWTCYDFHILFDKKGSYSLNKHSLNMLKSPRKATWWKHMLAPFAGKTMTNTKLSSYSPTYHMKPWFTVCQKIAQIPSCSKHDHNSLL